MRNVFQPSLKTDQGSLGGKMAVGDNDVNSDANKIINNKVGDPTLKKIEWLKINPAA